MPCCAQKGRISFYAPGVSILRQENQSPPTDFNGAGATEQTMLFVTEDDMQTWEEETTTRRNGHCGGVSDGNVDVFKSKREKSTAVLEF